MQRPHEDDPLWREAYRMTEIDRLASQQHDPTERLEKEHLISLCREAIDRHWAKQNPRMAERMLCLLRLRFVEEESLEACGVVLDVTHQRVRQMEAQLVTVIRKHLHREGVIG